MFIFVTCDVSPFAGFAWFLARAVLNGILNYVTYTKKLVPLWKRRYCYDIILYYIVLYCTIYGVANGTLHCIMGTLRCNMGT